MRKTGSTFLATALERALPPGSIRSTDKHYGWQWIPAEAAALPVLAYVRNPWDWYVSWYHFNVGRETQNGIFRALSADCRNDFATTVRNACAGLTALIGGDLYSSLFRNLVGDGLDSPRLTVGRFESFADDLEHFFSCAGVDLPESAIAEVRAMPPLNTSKRGPYRDYYDDRLRDHVERSCEPLIERFGYRF